MPVLFARRNLARFSLGRVSARTRALLSVPLVGAGYYAGGMVGLAFWDPASGSSILWPPNAILTAALLLTPPRTWWLYLIACLPVHLYLPAHAALGDPLLVKIAEFAANGLQGLIAAAALRAFTDGSPRFETLFHNLKCMTAFIIVAALAAPAVASAVAAYFFVVSGWRADFWSIWQVRFFADVVAALTITPFVLLVVSGLAALRQVPARRLAEFGLLMAAVWGIGILVFGSEGRVAERFPALLYTPLPLLLWAAVRFGPAGLMPALVIIAFVCVRHAFDRLGPFVSQSPATNLLSLQIFLIAISLPLMLLAALIAERRARTLVLRESEARFRSLADTAPVLIWMTDRDKRCNFFNKGWLDFTGRSLAQELGDGWTEGVHPDDAEQCLRTYVNAFDARREFTMEYRLRRHDGEYRWVLDKGVPRLAPDGTFLGYIGCADDISERKLAEERAWQVVEAAPNAMLVVDQAGKITLANAAAETVFGYARDELIGRPVEMLLPERFRVHHAGDRERYLADPTARAMGGGREIFGRRKDASEVPIEVGLTPVRTSEGSFALASIIDITARTEAELAAQRHRAELAHVARISTMGELAASLAHELNQPLTAILSNVQTAQHILAADPADLDEVREILQDVVEDDKRAGEVIRRLRGLVRKEQPAFAPLDLGSVVRDVVLLVHSDAVLRNSRVTVEVSPGLPPVQGDRIELQQVALNLLVNAFDAMKDVPAPERQVVVRAELEGARMVRVSARDRGTGLAGADLERLFQPFYTTKRDGLGMGLSISRAIIEAHGGRLWAQNNLDRGATFAFTVPVAEAHAQRPVGSALDPAGQRTNVQ